MLINKTFTQNYLLRKLLSNILVLLKTYWKNNTSYWDITVYKNYC
jgi:hypothetical protein